MNMSYVNNTTLKSPSMDIALLLQTLNGAASSIVSWADELELFRSVATRGSLDETELSRVTRLTERGAEAFLGVLNSLHLVTRTCEGTYSLSDVANEYLIPGLPYYIGPSIKADAQYIPTTLLKTGHVQRLSERNHTADQKGDSTRMGALGSRTRLTVQHSRNFAQAVVAARTGAFSGIRHLVDVAGGSGVFAIPLALDNPEIE